MKMSTKQATLIHVNEDYIDMELTCSSSFSSCSQSREFEFQMTSLLQNERDSTTSPADDLFYKGKLLPLHLPPRLKMVQNLIIENNNTNTKYHCSKNATLFDNVKSFSSLEDSNFPSLVESCNISPSESCRVSSDNANQDEYFFGNWSSSSTTTSADINNNAFVSFGGDFPKKSWPKKMKMMKQFLIFQRLKSSSRAYLRSLFNKSGCSDKSCANASSTNVVGTEKKKKKKKKKKNNPFEYIDDDDDDDDDDCDNSNNNNNKKQLLSSCAVMKSLKREIIVEDDFSNHRRSFSGVVQRHCANNKALSLSTSSSGSSSSSSSSFSSGGYYDLQIFKRSISANNSELECSVEGAIAHCKNSQKLCGDSNNTSTFCVGGGHSSSRICSQFASKVAVCGNQDMASAFATNRG